MRTTRMANLRDLRKRIKKVPQNARGRRIYSKELREDISAYTRWYYEQGESYSELAKELGVSASSLRDWQEKSLEREPEHEYAQQRPMGFRTVTVEPEVQEEQESGWGPGRQTDSGSECTPVVVLPGGVRIEGVGVERLGELIRSLGCLS